MIVIILAIMGVILLAFGFVSKREQWLEWGYFAFIFAVFFFLSDYAPYSALFFAITVFLGILWLMNHKKRGESRHFVRFGAGLFPVIAVIFVIRSFVIEPFQIPSSSMRPGLVVSDFVVVNKFAYGLRSPIGNGVFLPIGKPKRGDVVVFEYPEDHNLRYIKRVVGVGGDRILYDNKKLTVNGVPYQQVIVGKYTYEDRLPAGGVTTIQANQLEESAGSLKYDILQSPQYPSFIPSLVRETQRNNPSCRYLPTGEGFACIVPEGEYFMMGDNRDNSEDSRYWGFVKDKEIVGKAFAIVLNPREMSRSFTAIR